MLAAVATGSYFKEGKRTIVFLHSWEWVAVWTVLWAFAGRADVAVVGGASWALHLAIDHASYNLRPSAYFLIRRAMRGFAIEAVCRDEPASARG